MRYVLPCCLLLAAACATGTVAPLTRFVIDPSITVPRAEASERTLAIRELEAGAPYRQPIVYRTEGHILNAYGLDEWSEPPDDMVTQAIKDAIVDSNRFADVGRPLDMVRPDLILTGTLRRFEEDRTVTPREAVVEVRLELRESLGKKNLWSATLTEREPFEGDTRSALAAAMSRAVSRIAEQAATEIAKF